MAESDPDPRLRARAAEAACREAVWTRRPAVLQRLAAGPRSAVRVVALIGLARAGRDDEVAGHLTDDASAVRAVARDAARRVGIDLLGEAVAALSPVRSRLPPTLAGELMSDPRVELRRAGYRLVVASPLDTRLQAALRAAGDRDAGLARRGRTDLVRLAGEAYRMSWPPLSCGSAELAAAAQRCVPLLDAATAATLRAWLAAGTG